MTDRAQIETLLRNAYAARKRGDVDAITQCFTEHPHFEMAGTPQASPIALRCVGQDQFRSLMSGLVKAFEWLDHEILSIIIEGDRAAVHWRGRMRSGINGEEIVTELVDVITVENGKIASFIEFCDTALAARLMGGAPAAREALFA